MPIDASIYGNQPMLFNPLEAAGQTMGVANAIQQNKLLQTHNQQAQLDLQNAQFQQEAGLILSQHLMDDGTIDFIRAASDPRVQNNPYAATKIQEQMKQVLPQVSTQVQDPETGNFTTAYTSAQDQWAKNAQTAHPDAQRHYDAINTSINRVNNLLNQPSISNKDVTNTAVDMMNDGTLDAKEAADLSTSLTTKDGSPVPKQAILNAAMTLGHANNQLVKHFTQNGNPLNNYNANPSVPVGYTGPQAQSRTDYNGVMQEAHEVPQKIAAYNQIINLNNQGALTGTKLAQGYEALAKTIPGLPQGITDKAAQTQAISKYLVQGLIAGGMPGSDARLQELQKGNINPDQLPETISKLTPFFKAVSTGALAKEKYINESTKNGSDLNNMPLAMQNWDQAYDPRWIEFSELKSNAAKKDFLKDHPDMIDSREKYNQLQAMGVVNE